VKLKDRRSAGKPILFLNTHFDHIGKEARRRSASLIRDRLESLGNGCSIVVTGDFNAGEGSLPYRALFDNDREAPSLLDAHRAAHPERKSDEGTYNGFKPDATSGERIDWIACSRDWKVVSAAIDRTTKDARTPSDHFPVHAVLKLESR
jgi:endonuclease/exonuclease/phosphatase family metal-dependent hydrolase